MKFDSLIFDIDGTIWDSTVVVAKAWNDALETEGYPNPGITSDRLKGLFGLPMDDIIRDILPECDRAERERVAPKIYEYEDAYLRKEAGAVYPGLVDMLSALYERIPLFIVSNSQAGYPELVCEKLSIGKYIKDSVCLGDTNMLKADNIKKVISDYDLKNPLYIGDTDMDHKACIEAGCLFCFAAYGFGKTENPDYVINSPSELISLVIES